ncbi:hypothetical protein SDC9_179050 [bioreactor metagenome]|uniref:Uncharacterized protein n=1 Tax=bioreactor metagenome TaxID=1076179 RepID=A0A645GZB0_9ZZZZ
MGSHFFTLCSIKDQKPVYYLAIDQGLYDDFFRIVCFNPAVADIVRLDFHQGSLFA